MPDVPLKTEVAECRHCRTRFRATAEESEFCCSGCRFVFHLLHKRGLEEFYHYGGALAPAGNQVFHERDHRWLADLQKSSEAENTKAAEAFVEVQGISCAACVWLIEAVFREMPGAVSCVVNASCGTARLRWRRHAADLPSFARDIQRFGYLLGPIGREGTPRINTLARRLGLCGFFALNTMLFASPRYFGIDPGDALSALFDLASFGFSTASIAVGGSFFFRRAWRALRARALPMDLPISLGLIFAYAGSVTAWLKDQHSLNYFDFVSIFTFLMLLGRWLQERAVESNRRRLLGLKLSPGRVRRECKGTPMEIDAKELITGDKFRVGRNQVVPVRSRLLGRSTLFALHWITGEPAPRQFATGDMVPSGARSLNEDDVECEALEDWTDSQLSALLRINAERTWRNGRLEKWIRVYLVAVLMLAAGGFLIWGLTAGAWLSGFQVMISVLVVSCPCAVGVALPLLDDLAAARLQQHGVYLREGSLWARIHHVNTLLLDKTGTVTLETLRPSHPEVLTALSATEKSRLLHLVGRSLHPVAACLREILLAAGVEPSKDAGSVREIPGMGLEWDAPEGRWCLGRASWIPSEGSGTVLALDSIEVARLHFREELRPEAAQEVARFQSAGMPVFLLSGDEPERVRAMGATLGLPPEQALGGLSPQEKADLVSERWADRALMLGDGANDSLAFDVALCRGTPAVDAGLLEHKADFYLLGRSLGGLGALFATARSRQRTARAVLSFAVSYNALAVAAALGGWMSPLAAAIIMPLSSLVSIGIVVASFRVAIPGGIGQNQDYEPS